MDSDYEFEPDEYEFEPDEYEFDELENQDGNQDGEEQDREDQDREEQDDEEQDDEEQDDEETTNISDSRKTAEVWKYFDIRTEHHPNHPVCKSCGQVFSQKTGNSSLERHLKAHQILISKNLQQTTINFQTITPHSPTEQAARDHAIVIWIIVNQQPFAIIENKYFRSMISKFDPKYKFPNRATIKKMIMELYEESREKIKQDLEKIPGKVSLTSDMWTSTHTQEAYLSITVHYINSSWELCHFLLDIIPFSKSHTAENMATEILKILKEFNLEKKVLGFTTDNASSMIACSKIIIDNLLVNSDNSSFNHNRCTAHILNLVAQKGIKILDNEIVKIRKLMTKVKNSVKYCDELRTLCNMKNLQYLKPELDIVTRWNSTYYMLQKLIKMDPALKLLVVDYENLYQLYPNTTEWDNIKV